jgi:hypothetical protein
LRANPEAASSPLYIFCDAARSEADAGAVAAVRDIVAATHGFAVVTPVLREQNLGLAQSIMDGVAHVLAKHDRVIVLEDDLYLSRGFLRYMNQALGLYEHDQRVASVHGYCYPVDCTLPETFFLRGADCWGWATWARAWRDFRSDGRALLRELRDRGLTHEFDLDGAYPFTRMLSQQVAGRNDSWAIRWHASCFLRGHMTLYPGRSLVLNTGNDSSGTHSSDTEQFDGEVAQEGVRVEPVAVEPSSLAREAFIRFLRPTIWSRIRHALSRSRRRA